MSYTNKTTHYELPQYVATDKPKYLTDFNETMATIDGQMYTNATAAATAQTAAEGAQSTADSAVSSIGTLNTQINGDPTDPSDTGLAGDVSALDGDVNTIQALLGNGTPTTSNQTVIGAVNAIEASIAPAEDSATLGANYDTGAQFARGGVVYEALVDLTAGTAFTALVLNTDYKVADTLVKQISEVASDVSDVGSLLTGNFVLDDAHVTLTATADGVKTWKTLIGELHTLINAKLADYGNGIITSVKIDDHDVLPEQELVIRNEAGVGSAEYFGLAYKATGADIICFRLHATAGRYMVTTVEATGNTVSDLVDTVPTSGKTVSAIVRKASTLS